LAKTEEVSKCSVSQQVEKSIFDQNFDRIFRQSNPKYCDSHDIKLENGLCFQCEQAKKEANIV